MKKHKTYIIAFAVFLLSVLSNVAFAQQTAAPTFSPVAVTTLPVDITIASSTTGANIYYTLDGNLPDNSSDQYVAPLPFDESTQRITFRACAYADGMTKSNVSSLSYVKPLDLIPATVTRTVDNNTTCSPDVKISVALTGSVSVYAVEERLPANVTPFNISDAGQWDEEARILRWGPFDDGQSRTLSYALAGTDMTLNFQGASSFDGRSLIPTGASQAAISCPIQQLQQVAAPVLTPGTGNVPITVTATCATDGAVLRYTTDGSVPDAGDLSWENNTGMLISLPTTLRVRAFKDGMLSSSTTLAAYQQPVSFTAKQRTITGGGTCTPQVSLAVTPAAGVITYAVEEKLASGLLPKNINEGGRWDEDNHAIKWGPFNDTAQRTFTYELAGLVGTYSISGRASADGRNEAIAGTSSLTITCSIQQVAIPYISPRSGSLVPLSVTLWCATSGSDIRYTTDGTAPDETSTLYTGSFELMAGARVRARAFKDSMFPSSIAEAVYPQPYSSALMQRSITNNFNDCSSQVSIYIKPISTFTAYAVEEDIPPGLTPSGMSHDGVFDSTNRKIKWGIFSSTDNRTVSYELTGARGTYKVDGRASFDGVTDPVIRDSEVTINCGIPLESVDDPVIAPATETLIPYDGSLSISIICAEPGANIRYTTNGSVPTESSSIYTGIQIIVSDQTAVRARAFKTGMAPSAINSVFYPKELDPIIAQPQASIETMVSSDNSCMPIAALAVKKSDAAQCWAAEEVLPDGLTPASISDGGVWDNETRTIRWGLFCDNDNRTLTYSVQGQNKTYTRQTRLSYDGREGVSGTGGTITVNCAQVPVEKVENPTFDPPDGTVIPSKQSLSVAIACATVGASIYYTTDGSVPDDTKALYAGPISIDNETFLRAKAYKEGMEASDDVLAVYTLQGTQAPMSRMVMVDDSCKPYVRIRLTPLGEVQAYAMEETLPVGIEIAEPKASNITNGGVWDALNRKVKWGPFLDNKHRTLMYRVTGTSGSYAIDGWVSFDGRRVKLIAGSDSQILVGTCQSNQEDPLADPDGDGLINQIEWAGCTDLNDGDTDDDGLMDGVEDANYNGIVDPGETNPCKADTDGDGIQDGTEMGYTLDDVWGDTNLEIFVPDTDPLTTTDSLNPDSDGDGFPDGEEALNGTDPNNPIDFTTYSPGVYTLDPSAGGTQGNGSPGSPWSNLQTAIHHINNGPAGAYVINLGVGTFSIGNGGTDAPLIITQDNVSLLGTSGGTTIVGSPTATFWTSGIAVTADNVIVQGITVTGFSGSGLDTTGTGTVINGCTLQSNGRGLTLGAGSGNTTVQNDCNIFGNTTAGITIDGSSGNVIFNNMHSIYDNGIGIQIINGSANNLIHDNNIYCTDGISQTIGILVQNAGSGNVIYSNTIHDHNGAGHQGIRVYNTTSANYPEIRQNSLWDNTIGMYFEAAGAGAAVASNVWNNLLYDTGSGEFDTGIELVQTAGILSPNLYHNTLNGGAVDGIALSGSSSANFKYNIITNFIGTGISSPAGPTIDYNHFYNNGSDGSTGTNSVSGNPGYVDDAAGNFHFDSTSPSYNSIPAASGDPVTVDLDGSARPQFTSYDMGCFEFTGVVCNYGIVPAAKPIVAGGAADSIAVTAGVGCAWTAVSNTPWIAVTAGVSGTGNGTVVYSVALNTGAARTGTMTIAGKTFTVNQDAASGGSATTTITSGGGGSGGGGSGGGAATSTTTSVPGSSVTTTSIPPGNATTTIPIAPPPAEAKTVTFSAEPLSGRVPLKVNFSAAFDGTVETCKWDFGDGTTSEDCSAEHIYEESGSFTVSLMITTPQGSYYAVKDNFINSGMQYGTKQPMISGVVNNAGEIPVTLYLNGRENRTVSSGPDGDYRFKWLPRGEYIVTPVAGSLLFDPPSYKTILSLLDAEGINFTASIPDLLIGSTFAQPSQVKADGKAPVLFYAAVSDNASVTIDLSSIGGSSRQMLYDDGIHGDELAGDGIYAASAAVSSDTAAGLKSLIVTASDSLGNTSHAAIILDVVTETRVTIPGLKKIERAFENLFEHQNLIISFHLTRDISSRVIKAQENACSVLMDILMPDKTVYRSGIEVTDNNTVITIENAAKGTWTYQLTNNCTTSKQANVMAQGSFMGLIAGNVIDAETGKHLKGVSITTNGGGEATTEDDGFYSIVHMEGVFTLEARYKGYVAKSRSVAVSTGGIATLDLVLLPESSSVNIPDNSSRQCVAEDALLLSKPNLTVLRMLRDRVLKKSRSGLALVELYYNHSPELNRMLKQDNALREEALGCIAALLPEVKEVIGGRPLNLTTQQRAKVEEVLRKVEPAASRQLKEAIEQVIYRLEEGELI